MRHTPLTATVTLALVSSGLGCHALGFQAVPGLGGALAGAPRPPSVSPVPGVLAHAGDSIFVVLPWILALTVAAVVVAFVIRILRNRVPLPGV